MGMIFLSLLSMITLAAQTRNPLGRAVNPGIIFSIVPV
jgi:hypothetical protein